VVTEVRAVKRQGSRKYLLVDAGFNTLARPVLYGSYHPMSLCPAKTDSVTETATEEVAVGGPLCESGDIFTQTDGGFVASRPLPPAQVGDLLVIEIAGAYGFVMASNYNSKPLPAEVLIDGGKARLVRARQTPEDLVRGETV
jgi:diaminopimelate decarboxylase